MKLRAVAVFSLVAAGCGETPSGPEPGGEGTLSMALVRTQQSLVPANADSAMVRIWHPTVGTNVVKRVAIPSPGDTTTVTFQLAARPGYSVGVVAFTRASNITGGSQPEGLAAGRADGVEVRADTTVEVFLDVRPWELSLTGVPDTLVSGETTEFAGAVLGAPIEDFLTLQSRLQIHTEPWTGCCPGPSNKLGSLAANGDFAIGFTAPTVEADTTVWFRFVFLVPGGDAAWQAPGTDAVAAEVYLPSSTVGDSLYTRPIVLGSGSIIVGF